MTTTPSHRIDGKMIAADVRAAVAEDVAALKQRHGIVPGLAVVLVGEDPASQVYVRNKGKQTVETGMRSIEHKLAAETGEAELLALVGSLNQDPDVHGILVQLPLPDHIDEKRVIEAIDPAKDVDGFHPINVGRLSSGEDSLIPCTPSGSIILLKSVREDLAGLNAVIVGRSNIVGKPAAALMMRKAPGGNATVTVAHSRTPDLGAVTRSADILVVAMGRPEMITGDMVSEGTVVIDVGTNRVDDPSRDKGYRVCGDVLFDEVKEKAAAISPVPGGVGPMTITMLLANTVKSAELAAAG